MKKLSFVILLTLAFSNTWAQRSHAIYKVPTGDPKNVTVLGTDPEFRPLQNLKSPHQVYVKMKQMGKDARYKKHINSLFTAMGYSGVNDPAFKESDVAKAEIPYGAIGMMGDGKHNYEYCVLNVGDGPYIPGWHVNAANGQDLNFMSRCGNAFYVADVSMKEKPAVCPTTRVQVYARYQHPGCSFCDECGWNDENVTGYPFKETMITEKVLIKEENARNYTDTKEVYVDVDKKTFRKLKREKEENYRDDYYSYDGK